MLVLDIETINKLKERDDMKDLKRSLWNMQETLIGNGMPLLDYVICRRSPKVQALMEKNDEFDARKAFIEGVKKLLKLKRYQRKKQFKFADLLKYMKELQTSEEERMEQKKDELYQTIRPLLQQKIEKLLTDSVEKLLGTVQKQDNKIGKITDVLRTISSHFDDENNAKSPIAERKDSLNNLILPMAIAKSKSHKNEHAAMRMHSQQIIGNQVIPEAVESPSPIPNCGINVLAINENENSLMEE